MDNDAFNAITKQRLEEVMREMLMLAEFRDGVHGDFFVHFLSGRFDLDQALVDRFLGRAP
jgi:hypothetical protein